MNEVIKAIKERRSIRSFKPDMPDKELIDQIIEAGLYAPSAKNRQGAIILKIANKQVIEMFREENCRIGGFAEGTDPFYGAPVILVVLGDASGKNGAYDGALVMQNLMLAAHSLGLGSIWINRAREEFEMEKFQKLLKDLGVEGEWAGVGHCAIGYIDGEVPPAHPIREGRVYSID
ncbi:MAG: nitroreductase [Erysipelotrichaceae bacterium]|nr:nitroreductase [Erysipelotrichaceae bacterium]